MEKENPANAERIHSNYEYTVAEVIWAAREEMAQTVEDVLARRVRLLFLDARAAIDATPKVAQILATELGKDQSWVDSQVAEFKKIAKGYLLVDYN